MPATLGKISAKSFDGPHCELLWIKDAGTQASRARRAAVLPARGKAQGGRAAAKGQAVERAAQDTAAGAGIGAGACRAAGREGRRLSAPARRVQGRWACAAGDVSPR